MDFCHHHEADMNEKIQEDCESQIQWDDRGLVPVITQDADSGRVLTLAWMNREALAATIESGYATYWSRSRAALWRKGETSGNLQRIVDIALDCDGDALLLRVEQIGGVACHTGRASCFYRTFENGKWVIVDPVLKDPEQMYGIHG